MRMTANRTFLLAGIGLFSVLMCSARPRGERWTAPQMDQLGQLSISRLEALAPDPTNRFADDPRAVALGRELFFDTRLSANGKVSCASCHQPQRDFQDGTALAHGVGTTNRRTMPIAGTAYAPFLFWDGRKDSQWAQALGPLENPAEHGGTRAQYARIIAESYRSEYERIFGALPDLNPGQPDDVTRVFVNIGKAIAAYERRLQHAPSRFDRYVDELTATGRAPDDVLTAEEVAGLRLFVGKANCTQCHNGPLLTNNEFHNTGVPANQALPEDRGRIEGAKNVLQDEFNCRSRWSDANASQCSELEFLITDAHQLERAYKVPSLRGVAERAPYMHAGQLATLNDVVAHYNAAPKAPAGHSEIEPLKLNEREVRQIVAFLRTLSGGIDAPPDLLRAPPATAIAQR
jgi:cytochrome c peroxidase